MLYQTGSSLILGRVLFYTVWKTLGVTIVQGAIQNFVRVQRKPERDHNVMTEWLITFLWNLQEM